MPGEGGSNPNQQDVLEFLAKPVEELDLGVRSSNSLRNAFESGYTVRQLVQESEKFMLRGAVPNFGRRSLLEVKELLEPYGLRFGMNPSELPQPEVSTPKAAPAQVLEPIQKRAAERCLRIKNGPNVEELKDLLVALMSDVPPRPDLHLEIDPFSLFALPLPTINEQKPFAEALRKGSMVEVEIPLAKLILKYNPHARTGTIEFKRH